MAADMTPEGWAEIKRVLGTLLTLDPGAREAALGKLTPEQRAAVTPYLDVDSDALDQVLPTETRERPVDAEVLAGRYRLDRELGRGGMGTVYLGYDLVLDRPVAIKRLRNPWLDDAQARRRLLNEARALAVLDHPHIARVQDVLDTSPPALLMEYVDGLPLGRWLGQPRPPKQVLGVIRDIVEAVAYAHRRDVVHCDLKPGNVLVTREGDVKVVDFGIALLRSRAETATVTSDSTRAPAYTPRYAAPEVVRGATPTPASDVYSLGVLIDEALDTCARAGHGLPPPLAIALGRVTRRAREEHVFARPRDAARLLAELPTAEAPVAPRRRKRLVSTGLVIVSVFGSAGMAMVGDTVSALPRLPILAVVPRVDADASKTLSAGAAVLFRTGLGKLTRARLASGDVPAFREDVPDLVKRLRDQGLSHVLVPTVAPFGSGVRMSVVIYRARDGIVEKTFTRYGRSNAMQALAREVAAEVRAWLGEPASVQPESTTAFQPTAEAFQLYSQARQYSGRPDRPGSLATARSLLDKAVQLEPAYAGAHAELGRVLYLMYLEERSPALLTQALASIETAVGQEPLDPDARITRAVLLQARGRRSDAIATLQDVLRTVPDHDQALRYLGRYEAAEGRIDAGVKLLERAVQLVPSWANYQALGNTLLRAGRFAQAVSCFEEVTQLQPDNSWGYQMLGAAHQYEGNVDAAAQAYRRSIEIQPIAEAVSNLATLEFDRGAYGEAARLYTEALALEPHDPLLARNLGDAERMRGRVPSAADAYQKAVELARLRLDVNPNDAAALSTASYASSRVARCDEAAIFGARAELAQPGALQPLANVTNAHVLCGRVGDAARLLRQLRAAGHDPLPLLEGDVKEQVLANRELKAALDQR